MEVAPFLERDGESAACLGKIGTLSCCHVERVRPVRNADGDAQWAVGQALWIGHRGGQREGELKLWLHCSRIQNKWRREMKKQIKTIISRILVKNRRM